MATERSEASAEHLVLKWEAYRRSHDVLPLSAQEQLRTLLRSEPLQHATRERVVSLLNPRGAHRISLSDEELDTRYRIVTTNNYAPKPCRADFSETNAAFDERRGYYIAPSVRPID